jgi:hypothetical protein
VRRLVVLLGFAASASPALADGPPACAVGGDPELGGTVAGILAARGIDAGQCEAVHARIDRRGPAIVVTSEGAGGAIERTVDDPATAATVIESWVRTDLATPLLAAHAVAIADPMRSPPELPADGVTDQAPAAASGLRPHAMLAFETSFASDRTTWVGPSIGACVMIGPVCAAAHVRFATLVAGPGPWDKDDRIETELLLGGDIPLHVGRVVVVPGFGGGIGVTGTHFEMSEMRMYSRTGGLRSDVHVGLEIPIAGKLALALTLGANIAQGTHVETNTTLVFPDEPWLIGRFGAGLRYGGT